MVLSAIKVAQETKSSILESSAENQRADSLVSIVTIIAILGGVVMGNTTWIDAIGGLCISVMIMRAAWGILRDTLGHA
jgi:divalent metal cation (Fe/Co/Zn/Cd) transporter